MVQPHGMKPYITIARALVSGTLTQPELLHMDDSMTPLSEMTHTCKKKSPRQREGQEREGAGRGRACSLVTGMC